jgi:hypothetical protein
MRYALMPFSIADGHAQCAPDAQLADGVHLLDIRKAPERAKVPDRRRAPVPGLVRSLPLQALSRRPIEQVHHGHHRFSQELCRHALLLEQGTSGCHHSLVLAFDHTILLQRVQHGVVALDPLIRAVGHKLCGGELAVVVDAQHLELEAAFLLRSSL